MQTLKFYSAAALLIAQFSLTGTRDVMAGCRVDSDVAGMLVQSAGASAIDPGRRPMRFHLIAVPARDNARPYWDIDYQIGGKKILVLADTGQIVVEGASGSFFDEQVRRFKLPVVSATLVVARLWNGRAFTDPFL